MAGLVGFDSGQLVALAHLAIAMGSAVCSASSRIPHDEARR